LGGGGGGGGGELQWGCHPVALVILHVHKY